MSITNNNIFPWRTENSFELLINGVEFYPQMLTAINEAKKFIFLETYFVESGTITTQFLKTLGDAVSRGVEVFVLFDDMGARNFNESDRILLKTQGINLCFYHPVRFSAFLNNFHRNHRKLLLIDDHLAFIGGAGLSDRFVGVEFWRDNMIAIQGEVLMDWHSLFIYNWQNHSEIPIIESSFQINHHFNESALGRLSYTHGYFFNQIKTHLHHKIKTSKNKIWLASAYFVPSLKLRHLLIQAAKRGVEIILMVPGPNTDNNMSRYIGQSYYNRLLKNKIKIFEYQNRFIHSKVVLVDDWVTIGSSNLDRWSAKWNLEANQEVKDLYFSNKISTMYQDDILCCTEITFQKWKKRPISIKLKIWFWKYIGKIITIIGLNGQK
jgi:phosphatidylserine/phosphatidylglycerophosphate/cardiolipin synthase-like enzyme